MGPRMLLGLAFTHYYLLTTIGKEVLNPLQCVPPHAILMEFHGQSVMRGFVEGLAEV